MESVDLGTAEHCALLALLLRGRLHQSPAGWKNGSKLFSAATIRALIDRGYVKQIRSSSRKKKTVVLTDSGLDCARNENAKSLGRQADRLTEEAMV